MKKVILVLAFGLATGHLFAQRTTYSLEMDQGAYKTTTASQLSEDNGTVRMPNSLLEGPGVLAKNQVRGRRSGDADAPSPAYAISPNPTNGPFNLILEHAPVGPAYLLIHNMQGGLEVFRSLGSTVEGSNVFYINENLDSGTYSCTLVVGQEQFIAPVTIL